MFLSVLEMFLSVLKMFLSVLKMFLSFTINLYNACIYGDFYSFIPAVLIFKQS